MIETNEASVLENTKKAVEEVFPAKENVPLDMKIKKTLTTLMRQGHSMTHIGMAILELPEEKLMPVGQSS